MDYKSLAKSMDHYLAKGSYESASKQWNDFLSHGAMDSSPAANGDGSASGSSSATNRSLDGPLDSNVNNNNNGDNDDSYDYCSPCNQNEDISFEDASVQDVYNMINKDLSHSSQRSSIKQYFEMLLVRHVQ